MTNNLNLAVGFKLSFSWVPIILVKKYLNSGCIVAQAIIVTLSLAGAPLEFQIDGFGDLFDIFKCSKTVKIFPQHAYLGP